MTHLETLTAINKTYILTKQNTITDGDLTFAKTDGLQTALDSKANSLRQIRLLDYKLVLVI